MTQPHPYIPATDAEEQEMLEAIGVRSFEELIKIIPPELRVKGELGLGPGHSLDFPGIDLYGCGP